MRSWLREEFPQFLEICALSGFAITQPLLSVFGASPETFVLHDATRGDIVWFAVGAAAVGVPLWAIGLPARCFGVRARAVAHRVVIAALVGLVALQVLKQLLPWRGVALVAAAVVLTAGFVVLHARSTFVQSWLRVAGVAPVVFVAVFLLASPTAELMAASSPGPSDLTIGAQTRVVLVIFDELPTASLLDAHGRIDRELYPNFFAFAAGAMFYRNHTAVAAATAHAIPGILTGQYPRGGTVPIAVQYPQSIFTLLGGSYRLHVKELLTAICPPRLCDETRPAGGLPAVLRDARGVYAEIVSPERVRRDVTARLVDEAAAGPAEFDVLGRHRENTEVGRYLAAMPAYPDSTLHVLHVLLPHVPWRLLPDGRAYAGEELPLGRDARDEDVWRDDEWPVTLARQRHLLQLRYTDALLGEIIATLRHEGLYDGSLVVVAADHGISFTPGHAARGLDVPGGDEATRPEVAWSPLIVKLPGATGTGVSDANVQAVDIVPTIADVLDVDIPWPVDGTSVLDLEGRGETKRFVTSKRAVVSREVGRVIEYDGRAGFREMLAGNVEAFAPDAGPLRLYRVGPHRDLVGRLVAGLATGAPLPWRVEADDASAFADVDADGPDPPAYVTATVQGAPAGANIAVVLNGRIAAVPAVADELGATKVGAVLPPHWLVDGRNDLRFVAVDGAPGLEVLRPLAGA